MTAAKKYGILGRKEKNMLRGFINCKSTEERINYITGSKATDWTEAEVAAVMEIVGVNGNYNDTPVEDKLNIIAAALGFTRKAEENDSTLFSKIEDEDEDKEQGLSREEQERINLVYAKFASNYYSVKGC